jgi:hypothetical protein
MNRRSPHQPGDGSDGLAPSESWLFAQAVLGKPIPRIIDPATKAAVERAELERLAQFSSFHAEALSRLNREQTEARHRRELLEWAAKISDGAVAELRAIERKEAAERDAWRRAIEYSERLVKSRGDDARSSDSNGAQIDTITEYDPNQPRQPKRHCDGWSMGSEGRRNGSARRATAGCISNSS